MVATEEGIYVFSRTKGQVLVFIHIASRGDGGAQTAFALSGNKVLLEAWTFQTDDQINCWTVLVASVIPVVKCCSTLKSFLIIITITICYNI